MLRRLPVASPKFSEFRNSAGVCSTAEGGDFPSASRDPGRVYTKQPRSAGRGDAKVTPERRAGPRGAPAVTALTPRDQRRRAHAPRSPNAAPSLEKSSGGYLGFCACRKEPQCAKDSVREPVRRLPPPTQAQPVARVATTPPPSRPASAPGPTDSRPGPRGSLPKAGWAWHPCPREVSPSELRRE